jgi:hypothetical protein
MTCNKLLIRSNIDAYLLQLKQYQERIYFLENYPDKSDFFAWLADYPIEGDENEPKVGQIVGTVEIDRENNGENLNIYPAFSGLHAYDSERDGIMLPAPLQNPFWAFFNTCISPGVQKWYPRYRHGQIYDINYDDHTASVNIDPVYPKQFGAEAPLFLNKLENLYGVPIDYMDCHSAAFEELDEVVVEFADNDWAKPKIKGFKRNPKPCEDHEIVLVRLGELGFVWDMKFDTYHEDIPGIQTYAACAAFVSGKVETTKDNDDETIPIAYRGFPYKLMLYQMYDDPDYEVHTRNYVTIGKEPFAEDACGKLITWNLISRVETGGGGASYKTITEEHSAMDCIFGELMPAFTATSEFFWNGWYYQLIPNPSNGYLHPMFGTGFDLDSYINIVCPIDHDESYYGLCSGAVYGNDAIGIANNGLRYSDKTLVQVLFNVWDPIYQGNNRTVVAHGGIDYWPWDDEGAPVQNPILQQRNADFSGAIYDLVEGLYVARGLTSGESDIGETYSGSGSYWRHYCEAGLRPYWSWITDPILEVKIYRR